MTILIILFWISLAVLFFCYLGYGLLLYCLNTLKKWLTPSRRTPPAEEEWPAVTMIIPAYNEGPVLQEKLENTKNIDYPAGKLKVVFVTDGSTDGSERLSIDQQHILLLHQPERQGKVAAIARAMRQVETPLVIFSDANAMLNRECVKKIVAHYTNPATGGVAGEKKITINREHPAIGEAEGLYWKYESFMKRQDAAFHTVVGAAGELFSMRTHLFHPPHHNTVLDDFVLSMSICLGGYRIEYEPNAFATELPSISLEEEAKRKIRISAGAYQAIGYLKGCLNPFKYPVLCFQYVSRRLLRWIFCPLLLIVLLVSNIIIAGSDNASSFYTWFLYGQLAFYFISFIGWLLTRSGRHMGIAVVPFYFVFMNYCLVTGFIRFLRKDQSVLWERSLREMRNKE